VKIRRDSFIAMHRQIAEHLRRSIVSGEYKVGDKLPSEADLARDHSVARITARQALMQLSQENLVVRTRGKGTFVAGRPIHHELLDLHGIYDELVAQGVNPGTQLLEFDERIAPVDIQNRLRFNGGKVVHWKRLYIRDDTPFALSSVFLAPHLRPTKNQVMQHSSYHLFEEVLGVSVARADVSVRAKAASIELRKSLRLRNSAPLIALERVSYDSMDSPLEYTLYWANAENYEFFMRLKGSVSITSSIQEVR
jgi:GntR family transcriptional regulator